MNTGKLPDCPETKSLITYLEQRIKECNDAIVLWAGVHGMNEKQEILKAKKSVYSEILEKIR